MIKGPYQNLRCRQGPYGRMNNTLFICQGIKNPDHVLIQVWKEN